MTHPQLAPPGNDPLETAREAAGQITQRTGIDQHDIALVLGSGWGQAAGLIGTVTAELPAAELAGFSAPVVAGHEGWIKSVHVAASGKNVLVLGSRTHLYEGRGARAVAHAVRVAAAAGVQQLVLTNGCGGLNEDWPPGTPVLISDHLNLTGTTPLEGATFVDMSEVYSQRLRNLALEVDPTLASGVYAQFSGPQYETPAEVRMARTLGADLVGMSTALEAIAARAAGLEILGLSLVTNLAAGISPTPLSHTEVIAAGRQAGPRISQLLAQIVTRI